MKLSLLLICGSRALAGTDGETWARRVITARVAELPPGGYVIHGGCKGSPDVWAGEIAIARGDLTVCAYHADGRQETHVAGVHTMDQWSFPIRKATAWEHFHERNMKMVNEAEVHEWRGRGKALVICLAAAASKTQGGPWTAKRAREHGLESHTWSWP